MKMEFNWHQYFDLAKSLMRTENEANYRTAVSRAYYALFNVLCGCVTNFKNKTDRHRQLIDILKDEFEWHRLNRTFESVEDYDIRHIGFELNDLRDLRNSADYNAKMTFTKAIANETIERVELIFEIIEDAENS